MLKLNDNFSTVFPHNIILIQALIILIIISPSSHPHLIYTQENNF